MEPTEEVSGTPSPRGSCSSEKQQHLDLVVSSLLCNYWFVYVLDFVSPRRNEISDATCLQCVGEYLYLL